MANKKQKKRNKFNYFWVGLFLEVMFILAIFKFGFIGDFLYKIVSFFLGTFSIVFLLVFMVLTFFLMAVRLHKIFKDSITYAILLLIFNMYFIYSIIFYALNKNMLTTQGIIKFNETESTPGNIGLWLNKVGFFLFDVYGSILISIIIFVFIIYLFNIKYDFLDKLEEKQKELSEQNKINRQDRKYQKVLKQKQKMQENLDYTQTLIDTSSLNLNEYVREIKNSKKREKKIDERIEKDVQKEVPVFKSNETMALQLYDQLFSNREKKNTANDEVKKHIELTPPITAREKPDKSLKIDPVIDRFPKTINISQEVEKDTINNNIVEEVKESKEVQQIEVQDQEDNSIVATPLEVIKNENALASEVEVRPITQITKNDVHPTEIGRYKLPSIDNLADSDNNLEQYNLLMEQAKEKGDLLVSTLQSFKLKVKILDIVIGPSVTRYELQPEVGIKVSRFNSLSNDIALSLAASDVRIEAPIPGKAAIGIEVPNSQIMMVNMKEIFTSDVNNFDEKIQVALGKDISGQPKFLDIAKTPHMLVAGATGSGKSVCINTIITSILLKSSPEEVKMVMVDPKKVELTPYNNIPHLLCPVVTDPKKASIILHKMVAEMEYRYELFAETNTRNIASYNEKIEKDDDINFKKLPYIVIIVDELADLMMVASNEVETAIARIAQMARAAGMHLILATQRPSTDVITGLIKSNIPTRIAFSVSSGIDSRTILDKTGAEKLLGKGDMLLSTATSPNLLRIQGAYLSDEEISNIVSEVNSQYSQEDFQKFHSNELSDEAIEEYVEIGELDEFYEDVKRDVIQMQKASAAYIQRQYRVGYNRACDILDQLEKNNIISANEGTKPRKVLIQHEDDIE